MNSIHCSSEKVDTTSDVCFIHLNNCEIFHAVEFEKKDGKKQCVRVWSECYLMRHDLKQVPPEFLLAFLVALLAHLICFGLTYLFVIKPAEVGQQQRGLRNNLLRRGYTCFKLTFRQNKRRN